MPRKSAAQSLVLLLAVVLLAFAGACSTDSPTAPERPDPTPPGGGGGGATAFNVTVTAQPGTVAAGSDDPVLITVRAVRTDNGQPAPAGTLAVVSAFEGSFGAVGGPQSVTVELVNGVAQVSYFPPADEEGSVTVQATVAGSRGQVTIEIEGTATFFVSHVTPSSGSPQGGDTVAIIGNGFEGPVRVLFGGTNAVVLSVTPTRITVRTPPSPADDVTDTVTVPVTVTINVNEEEEQADTISGAFTYRPGGTDIQQPTIFSVTPATGTNEGGTQVSILGEGFQSPVQVQFCNGDCVEASVISVSPNRLEVRSPAATGFGAVLRDAPVDIRVTNLNSGLTTTSTDAFRYGVEFQVTGLQPDVVDAESPGLVTIFGRGFESPLQVLVGGVQQQVISVTGTEVVFRPSSIPITSCPEPGAVVSTRDVTVRLLSSGAESGSFDLNFTATVPRPVITGISPNSGPAGGSTTVNLDGSGFEAPVRVLFGGNQAPLLNTSANQVRVTTPAFTGDFPTEACTATGGVPGTRQRAVSVEVSLTNLNTGCTDTVPGGFIYQPPSTCVPNEAPPPPPQCSDGIDNDGDGLVDFGAGPTNDPQCTSAADSDESV